MSMETMTGRIRLLLAEHERLRFVERENLERRMNALDARRHRFERRVLPILREVIEPHVQALAEEIGDAECETNLEQLLVTARFNRSGTLPLSLGLAVGVNLLAEGAELRFVPHIRPAWCGFPPEASEPVSPDQPDAAAVSAFLDGRLVHFAARYLELQGEPAFLRRFLVADPVCGMRIDRLHAAASLQQGGSSCYFCSEACRDRFLAGTRDFRP